MFPIREAPSLYQSFAICLCYSKTVEITCNFPAFKCVLMQLGSNPSALNGNLLKKKTPLLANHGDILEVLAGSHKYRIEFDPPPPTSTEDKPPDFNLEPSCDSDKLKSSLGEGSISEEDSISKVLVEVKRDPTLSILKSMPKVKAVEPKATTTRKRETSANEDSSTKKLKTEGFWKSVESGDLLIYNANLSPGSQKVAAYDMDGTLITTQSGRVFATDYNDWKIIFSEVPGKLKSLHQDGFKILFFTNQAGIGTGKQTAAGIQGKIESIIGRLGVPVQAFVATNSSKYRKPLPYMWNYFEEHCNSGVSVERTESVYVGDAAGRPEVPKTRKKDHSCADRLFALNLGVPFETPEQHFLGRKPETMLLPSFDPRVVTADGPLYSPASTKVPAHASELVVMVGFPGSGKSLLSDELCRSHGYVAANRDQLGTWQRCASLVQKTLQDGGRVVVDNTNPDRASRARYLKVAQDVGVPARCFVFNVNKQHAMHNNRFRELTEPKRPKVSEMVYNMYNSKFEKPELSEGFKDIVTVNFVPRFQDKKKEELYRMFLLEK
ncbi:uncharacterized protein F21D5.5-like isoform X2 [Hyalella azteca]|uniref:Uncharacterized protein F21D5.5-like isoform X2 n=1 Tax=Hyalella azteca TaxID=294128 RepID=A0A8B7P7Q1_HYAAZ|nr:uncharacterized protein F21D5.5-like isoform X2 [Hyalella azteca]